MKTRDKIFPFMQVHFGDAFDDMIDDLQDEVTHHVQATLEDNARAPRKHGKLHAEMRRHVKNAADKLALAYLQGRVETDEKWVYGMSVAEVHENATAAFEDTLQDAVRTFFEERRDEGTAEELIAKYVTAGKFSDRDYRYTDLFKKAVRSKRFPNSYRE
ncbi:hypothetical protein [Salisaeta icosahedral phage 1]|uniref:hypothetical protein n=1 Tax=Salisaeta icosahedral phage 1 TaxID=1183239 RepID=UPI00025EA91D|nr:hypothetical protein A322_gp16 [Salisaeta icosahedral phage 1]AFJ21471.1 hypothetical protein [Salisaeta icosahedral phage 1]